MASKSKWVRRTDEDFLWYEKSVGAYDAIVERGSDGLWIAAIFTEGVVASTAERGSNKYASLRDAKLAADVKLRKLFQDLKDSV